ncbi:MAG: queuosine precursor transporter [Bacillota bacterium]|nr:queuosine precursor transporter [Bacillota bacterium]
MINTRIENKRDKEIYFRLMLWSFYAVAVVMKNILATKTWSVGFITAPAAYIFEPVTFIAQDVETETKGYGSAKKMIFWGFFLNLLVALASQLAILLPNASAPIIQDSFAVVLGNVPRILFASLTAYLIGGNLNAKIMDSLKAKNKTSLFSRAIISTMIGQLADNLIFTSLAFYGVMDFSTIIRMALSMTLLETIYEIVFFPVTKTLIKKFKDFQEL